MNQEQFEKEWEAAGHLGAKEPLSTDDTSSAPLASPPDPYTGFWKAQAILCVVFFGLAVGLRFLGGTYYDVLRTEYIARFCDTTSPQEVIESPSDPVVTPTQVPAMATVTQTQTVDLGDTKDDSLAVKENHLVLTSASTNQMTCPVKGRVTSPFGYRIHPIYGTKVFHNGVDIGADTGTPIVAAMDGVVEESAYDDSYGYYLVVHHGNQMRTVYAHCDQLLVQKGQQVTKGQTIAQVGSTGVSTGPHLHFEVRRGEYRLNPAWLVDLE